MHRLAMAAAVPVCIGAYVVPYFSLEGVWWRFVPSTVVILGAGFLVLRDDATRLFGLAMSRRDLAQSALLFGILLPLSYLVLSNVVATETLTVHREIHARSQVHQFFQVFNDEIFARAALLTVVLNRFPHPKTMIFALALVFAVGHRLTYGIGGVEIGAPSLVALFCLGVIANTLFVRFRHIGYGLAIHYAWNFWRFNTGYYLNGRYLSEGDSFNYVEGHPWVVGCSFVAMLFVFGAYASWARRSYDEPHA